ncbi:MAG: hypothetical protein NC253_07985 [Ruminococcus sp.]|nr:hypothetical protein [Ruminococcus sp.]MCM1478170.1 hypothetical protein [Muribaculaceae bacterium]
MWKNSKDGSEIFGEKADFILEDGAPRTGLLTRKLGGAVCTFNVMKRTEAGRLFYIIELVNLRNGGGVSAETVRDYVLHICAEVKTAVREISSVTDRLFGEISSGKPDRRKAAKCLDRICENAAALERDMDYPEKLCSAEENSGEDIIILDREMAAVSAGAKALLNGVGVRISEDYDREIFFRMNADMFETAVSSIAAECCRGKRFPERIIFSARRSERNRAEIAVMSLDTGASPGRPVPERMFGRKLFAEYVRGVLEFKNGVRFKREKLRGGYACRMNIETLPRGVSVYAAKPVDGSGRQKGIAEKLEFFFGYIPASERRRYTSESGYDKNSGEPERVRNIYREDIENEKTKT